MNFPTRMEDSYYYEENQEVYYEEYSDYNHEEQYYQDTHSDFSYSAQDHFSDENMELCAGMEEEPPALWEVLLDKCITELEENRKITNLRLDNLERNIAVLEQTLSNLVLHVGDLEYPSDLGKARKEPGRSSSDHSAAQPQWSAGELSSDPLDSSPISSAVPAPATVEPTDRGLLEGDQMPENFQRPVEKQPSGPPPSSGPVNVPFSHRLTS